MHPYLRYVLFFGVVLGVVGGTHYFVYRRLSASFALGRRAKNLLIGLLVSGVAATVASRLLARLWPAGAAHTLAVVGSVLVLGVAVTFALLALDALVRAGFGWARRLVAPIDVPEEAVADEGRRDVLQQAVAASAVALGGGSSLYASVIGRHDYVIEEVPIRLARLPRELDGYTLVQLSDLHVGLNVGEPELAAALDLVAQARPDRIVLTGDLIDHDPRFAEVLGRFVRRLGERAPVSAVIGNHDYYAGIRETLDALRRAGADVLVNESRLIEDKLVLGGVDDVWARRENHGRGPDAVRAFAGSDPELPRVLLCHNPSYYPEAADLADLQLSGHTHGGQFSPLVNPARVVLRHGYIRGRYERARSGDRDEAKSQLYVNRGFGTAGPPARIGSPPEVTKIILES